MCASLIQSIELIFQACAASWQALLLWVRVAELLVDPFLFVYEHVSTLSWPYIKIATKFMVIAGIHAWEVIKDTDPLILASIGAFCVLLLLLWMLKRYIARKQYVRRTQMWFHMKRVRFHLATRRLRDRKNAVMSSLQQKSRLAAAVFPHLLLVSAISLFVYCFPETSFSLSTDRYVFTLSVAVPFLMTLWNVEAFVDVYFDMCYKEKDFFGFKSPTKKKQRRRKRYTEAGTDADTTADATEDGNTTTEDGRKEDEDEDEVDRTDRHQFLFHAKVFDAPINTTPSSNSQSPSSLTFLSSGFKRLFSFGSPSNTDDARPMDIDSDDKVFKDSAADVDDDDDSVVTPLRRRHRAGSRPSSTSKKKKKRSSGGASSPSKRGSQTSLSFSSSYSSPSSSPSKRGRHSRSRARISSTDMKAFEKTVDSVNILIMRLRRLTMYWVLYAIFIIGTEAGGNVFLSYLPMWQQIKMGALVWLWFPLTDGIEVAYDLVIPFIHHYIKSVHQKVDQVKKGHAASSSSSSTDAQPPSNYSGIFMMMLGVLVTLRVISPKTQSIILTSTRDSGVVLCSVIFFFQPGFITRYGCLFAGLAYPSYTSILRLAQTSSAIELDKSKITTISSFNRYMIVELQSNSLQLQNIMFWLMYWQLIVIVNSAYAFSVFFFGVLPLQYHCELLFLLYLQVPPFRGAKTLYTALVKQLQKFVDPPPVDASEGSEEQENHEEKDSKEGKEGNDSHAGDDQGGDNSDDEKDNTITSSDDSNKTNDDSGGTLSTPQRRMIITSRIK